MNAPTAADESQIVLIGFRTAAPAEPKAPRKPRLRKGKPVLAEAIRSIMNPDDKITAGQIVERLQASNLASGAKNLKTMVLQTLSKNKDVFAKVKRGVYRLKA